MGCAAPASFTRAHLPTQPPGQGRHDKGLPGACEFYTHTQAGPPGPGQARKWVAWRLQVLHTHTESLPGYDLTLNPRAQLVRINKVVCISHTEPPRQRNRGGGFS